MCRDNVRPFFTFAQSNSGKTIIGTNCVLEAVQKQYSQIIYITQTYNSPNNIFLRNNVLKQFIFNPYDSGKQNNRKLTDQEVKDQFANFLIAIQSKLYQQLERQQKIYYIIQQYLTPIQKAEIQNLEEQYCSRLKQNNPFIELVDVVFNPQTKAQANQILNQAYSINNINQFYNYIQEVKDQLQNLFLEQQTNNIIYQRAEMSKSLAFNMFLNKIDNDYKKFKQLIQQQQQKFIIQQFNDLLQQYPQEVKQCLQNQENYQGDQKIKDICDAIQSPIKFCIIFDDVSELINSMSSDTKKSFNGQKYQKIIADFFDFLCNKGRHFGTFYVALHGPDSLPSTTRKLIGNFIIAPNSIDSFVSQRVSALGEKDTIKRICRVLEDFNQSNGKHYVLVYFENPSENLDNTRYAIMQAKYNQRDQFNTQDYKINKYFYYLACKQNQL